MFESHVFVIPSWLHFLMFGMCISAKPDIIMFDIVGTSEACNRLAQVKKSAQYLALPVMHHEVSSVENLVQALHQDYCPRLKDASNYSSFFRLALKRVEYFAVVVPKPVAGLPDLDLGELFGCEAVRRLFEEVKDAMNSSKAVDIKKMKPLKLFAWLFNEVENDLIKKWMQTILKRDMGPLRIGDGGDDEDNGASGSVVPYNAAASASGAASSAGPVVARSKCSLKTDAVVNDRMVNMMKFFQPKVKRA